MLGLSVPQREKNSDLQPTNRRWRGRKYVVRDLVFHLTHSATNNDSLSSSQPVCCTDNYSVSISALSLTSHPINPVDRMDSLPLVATPSILISREQIAIMYMQ